MIRDRLKEGLKSVARKAAIKVFKMEFDTEERDPANRLKADPTTFDPSVIPKLVDGDGDTPGPNHRTNIGRTWVAAQLVAGAAPFFIDLRPPAEVVSGILPGSLLLPGELVKQSLGLLPTDKAQRVIVYDQTGEGGSEGVAAWLRENGWPMARRLQGGYAEWIEHAEPIETPRKAPGARFGVGDPVRAGAAEGWVLRIEDGPRYLVWHKDGSTSGPHAESALR